MYTDQQDVSSLQCYVGKKREWERVSPSCCSSLLFYDTHFLHSNAHIYIHLTLANEMLHARTYVYTRLPMKAYVTLFLLGVASYTVGCGSTVALVTGRVTGVCESLSSCAIILHFQMVHQTEVITVTVFLCLFVNKSNSRKFCKFRNQPQLTNRLVSN